MVCVLFLSLACVASVSVRFRLSFHFSRGQNQIPFLGLSQCFRNQTETLAVTQAILSWAQFHVNVAHNTMTMTALV